MSRGYDAWLEEPYQREADDEARWDAVQDRIADELGTDCGCCRDEGDNACRDRAQCDECDRASNLGDLLINWQAADAETGTEPMPPEVHAYLVARDKRRAARDRAGIDEDFREP